jgi:hypothetical protein
MLVYQYGASSLRGIPPDNMDGYTLDAPSRATVMNSPDTENPTGAGFNAAGRLTCKGTCGKGTASVVLAMRINKDRNIIHHALL